MKRSIGLMTGMASVGLLAACAAGDSSESNVGEAQEAVCGVVSGTNINRSLVVTDPTILAKFSFKRTMDQIRMTANVGATETTLGIFQRWMRTFGSSSASGDCNDPNIDPNHYGLRCPRVPEAKLATANPFTTSPLVEFKPVGLFNRFDLAPTSGAHCGEYRIVYAMTSSDPALAGRAFIIFEGALPNPTPSAGVGACLPVAQFWQGLTSDNNVASRAAKLEKFYFTGGAVAGFAPLVDAAHYGLSTNTSVHPAGQVRTDFFIDLAEWNLREFRLRRNCVHPTDIPRCTLAFEHVTVKENPAEELFAGTHSAASAFQAGFLNQVAKLAATNVNRIGMGVADQHNEYESVSQALNVNYASNTQAAFRSQIQGRLTSLGSTLTVNDILNRATTQTCAGCHQVSNGAALGGGLTWPSSMGFVHIDESSSLSPALTGVFLPERKAILEMFINVYCGNISAPTWGVGLTLSGAPEGSPN